MSIAIKLVLSILSILQAAGGTLDQGVFYDEMEKPPLVWVAEGQIHIHTTNSLRNSSLAIFSTQVEVVENRIVLSAQQQLVGIGPQPDDYHHDLEELGISEEKLASYSLWWRDPDEKEISMEFQAAPAKD